MNLLKPLLLPSILLMFCPFISCKKPEPVPIIQIDNSKVSYEITGTYSGKLTVLYVRADGVRVKLNRLGLPWSKSINPGSEVTLVYFKADTADDDTRGKSGETAKASLYIGGELYRTYLATADAKGILKLDSLYYNY